ncbi:MAG TPA: hypothetical protein VE377_25280 [Candidatus Dormibacteraeota bacterium]|nr:hypothetical protein [Candidatus Dormibacteraeota bacterium]
MKVLFLHPEDVPWQGPWAQQRWDLIVDLGFASCQRYKEWSGKQHSRILSVHEFAGQMDGYRWVNQVFERGRRRLLDRTGLDWWEILAMESYQDLHAFYLFHKLRAEIATDEIELTASRPHRLARIAEQALGHPVHYSENSIEGPAGRVTRALRSARNLRWSQITEIALDKWDAGYRLRRRWMQDEVARLQDPAVLLPSAYSNVTRSALAYAGQLPNRKFLLVTTRRSAIPAHPPANVTVSPLAAYVRPAGAAQEEAVELKEAWQTFLRAMTRECEEFHRASKAGVWDYFPAHLEHGLLLREAWTHLLDSEPVTGVLCGDDLNYHTRLPLMLAQRRGLNAVYCSHGALDGGFLFKTPVADSYLVKGEMESDYLQRIAAIRPEKIVVAAPGTNNGVTGRDQDRDALVFFSQPYEVASGRTDSIYREILPRLCSAARAGGRTVIVKLHPFESRRSRQLLVNSILPSDVRGAVEIVDGTQPEEVMARAWCGVTVDSSVAVECALRKIPFFLCGWLDFTGMGYLQQFARFGVAHVLNTPEEIEQISEMVAGYRFDPETLERLWHEADASQLDEIMFGTRQARLAPCVC